MIAKRSMFLLVLIGSLAGCGDEKRACETQDHCLTGFSCVSNTCRSSAELEQMGLTLKPFESISGEVQFEQPCMRAGFPNGCVRIVSSSHSEGGNLKYIDREARDNGIEEFTVLTRGVDGAVARFSLPTEDGSTIELKHGQTVTADVVFEENGTKIVSVTNVVGDPSGPKDPGEACAAAADCASGICAYLNGGSHGYCAAAGTTGINVSIAGTVQFEAPCIRSSFPNGCVRIVTSSHPDGGTLKYIDRESLANATGEFTVLARDLDGAVSRFSLPTDDGKTIELEHGQPITADVVFAENGTRIISLINVVAGDTTPQPKLVRGTFQLENPCVRADFPDGCVRIVTSDHPTGGNLKYVDRPAWANAAELTILTRDTGGNATLVRFFYDDKLAGSMSIDLVPGAQVEATVVFDSLGTTIVDVQTIAIVP